MLCLYCKQDDQVVFGFGYGYRVYSSGAGVHGFSVLRGRLAPFIDSALYVGVGSILSGLPCQATNTNANVNTNTNVGSYVNAQL
jgi:hypothetical protein